MSRLLLILILLSASFFGMSSHADNSKTIEQIEKKIRPSIVMITDIENMFADSKHDLLQLTRLYKFIGYRYGFGFVISEDGLILTNAHVVDTVTATDTVNIAFVNGESSKDVSRAFIAKVLIKDNVNDIAVLKINPSKKLKSIALDDDSKLQIKEQIMTIGKSKDSYNTIMPGNIINSSVQTVIDGGSIVKYSPIEILAHIGPGNSGSPVINSKGKVVGMIKSGIVVEFKDGFTSISDTGFVIPSNIIKGILNKLLDNYEISAAGYVKRKKRNPKNSCKNQF